MELDQDCIPRHYLIFRNHWAAKPVATNDFSLAQHRADGPGSGAVMSWLNTPMLGLLEINGSSEVPRIKRCTGGRLCGGHLWKMDMELKNASGLIALVTHGPRVQMVTLLFAKQTFCYNWHRLEMSRNSFQWEPGADSWVYCMCTIWPLKLCVCALCAG